MRQRANGHAGQPRPTKGDAVERGRFVEVMLPFSGKDRRKRWVLGHVLGVGPCTIVEQRREHEVPAGKLLVKLHHGTASAYTLHEVDRQHDEWRLLFP